MRGDDEARTRTIRWEDPMPALAAGRAMSGLDYLRALRDRRLAAAPITTLVGFRLTEVEEGRVAFECEPGEHHYNPIGSVHGGVAATLLDSAMGCAINTLLPIGTSYTTLEIKVNYLRPMTKDTGTVRAGGWVISVGEHVAVAEGRIVDAGGRLYASATTTCLVMRP